MKKKYAKPTTKKIPYTIDMAFGKKCGLANTIWCSPNAQAYT